MDTQETAVWTKTKDDRLVPEFQVRCGDSSILDAAVKWDGCVNLWRTYDGPKERDYIHICDLDEYIEQLIALRDAAKAHFKDNWPG